MMPSTLKYRIEMTPFGFSSEFNYLQLIMSTSFQTQTDEDSCSYQETGQVVNSDIEFVRLQINDNSLYCRYIKKGVIDNRIQSISNSIFSIDSSQQTSTNISRQVGINIPYYRYNALIDPDYSFISDLLPANDKDGSICDPLRKRGLTKLQILGIIFGGVGLIIVLIIIYFGYKMITDWNFKIKFWRKVDRFIKMKKLNKL
ncbi:hypothetical protein DLAC_08557 [Tieghemostelium lacteum]|uniref:ComC supersandwich domain-containing protein n=1 Tax=Tieghemostelium lacteum TaxID=361077 RepID=A0A151Z7P2_TIELA|nr:hypothetical protein DLAC_08557 [Tieghemostelium lacteum]|eukprot:KYQ89986.1 hypothetical protein DLAC_08557 [Tieghemostelium lacteum]